MHIQLLILLMGLVFAPFADAAREDIDDEWVLDRYKPKPGSEWRELELELPEYPDGRGLTRVHLSRGHLPFKVYVDTDSVTVGDDYIVRYTVVLRSKRGAETVSYEGIQCNQRRYKRYAYGSGGRFHPVPRADWRFIRSTRQDVYRRELADEYFCPLPSGNIQKQLRKKLKRGVRIEDFTSDE